MQKRSVTGLSDLNSMYMYLGPEAIWGEPSSFRGTRYTSLDIMVGGPMPEKGGSSGATQVAPR